jgi:hypothetical protein
MLEVRNVIVHSALEDISSKCHHYSFVFLFDFIMTRLWAG